MSSSNASMGERSLICWALTFLTTNLSWSFIVTEIRVCLSCVELNFSYATSEQKWLGLVTLDQARGEVVPTESLEAMSREEIAWQTMQRWRSGEVRKSCHVARIYTQAVRPRLLARRYNSHAGAQ